MYDSCEAKKLRETRTNLNSTPAASLTPLILARNANHFIGLCARGVCVYAYECVYMLAYLWALESLYAYACVRFGLCGEGQRLFFNLSRKKIRLRKKCPVRL